MSIVIIALISLFVVLILNIKSRQWYNPLCVYLIFWTILLFLSTLHLNGLYEIREEVLWMFAGGMLFFTIGFAIANKCSVKSMLTPIIECNISYKITYILLIITIVYLLFRATSVILSLRSGMSAMDLRYLYYGYEAEDQSSRYSFYVQTFIVTPIIYASSVIAVMDMLMGMKNKFLLALTVLANVLFILISGGGRVVIMNVIFHTIFLMMILNKRFELSPAVKRRIRWVVLVLIIAFFFVNAFRGKGNAILDLLNEAYKYYAGSVQHFQVRIDRLGDIRDHGVALFAGYIRPALLVLGLLGIKAPNNYNVFLYQNSLLQNGTQIGDGVWYNAFATMNYHFYLSFGVAGIMIGNFLFGIICAIAYKKMKRNQNYWTIGVLLLMLQCVLTSMVRWQFAISTFALSFIYLRFMVKRVES